MLEKTKVAASSALTLCLVACQPAMAQAPTETPSSARASPQHRAVTSEEPRAPELLLRVYELPAGQGPGITEALSRVLSRGASGPVGTARLTPDGSLLVLAPLAVHSGVAEMLESRDETTLPRTVELRYWFVDGRPRNETEISAGLESVGGALTSIAGDQGPMQFVLSEQSSLRSLSGHHGRTSARHMNTSQTASVVGEQILVDLHISGRGRDLSTTVRLEDGGTVVLGEMGSSAPEEGWTTYVILQSTIVGSTPSGAEAGALGLAQGGWP